MKSNLLIGLGRFGKHIAMKLRELNHQVMAVDHKEELVQEILPYVTNAQIGDSTNEEFLRSLGVDNYDVCIVGIGNRYRRLDPGHHTGVAPCFKADIDQSDVLGPDWRFDADLRHTVRE